MNKKELPQMTKKEFFEFIKDISDDTNRVWIKPSDLEGYSTAEQKEILKLKFSIYINHLAQKAFRKKLLEGYE